METDEWGRICPAGPAEFHRGIRSGASRRELRHPALGPDAGNVIIQRTSTNLHNLAQATSARC